MIAASRSARGTAAGEMPAEIGVKFRREDAGGWRTEREEPLVCIACRTQGLDNWTGNVVQQQCLVRQAKEDCRFLHDRSAGQLHADCTYSSGETLSCIQYCVTPAALDSPVRLPFLRLLPSFSQLMRMCVHLPYNDIGFVSTGPCDVGLATKQSGLVNKTVSKILPLWHSGSLVKTRRYSLANRCDGTSALS